MKVDLSIVISFIALLISIGSIYLQWFRVKGAMIALLNGKGGQRTYLRPYERLPQKIQDLFPNYNEKYPGYAIVNLVLGNSGDRVGMTHIITAEVTNYPIINIDEDKIRCSFYEFNIISAYDIVSQHILLRNIPQIKEETTMDFKIKIKWGGANHRTGQFEQKGILELQFQVVLMPTNT